jgi:hypothetical protein
MRGISVGALVVRAPPSLALRIPNDRQLKFSVDWVTAVLYLWQSSQVTTVGTGRLLPSPARRISWSFMDGDAHVDKLTVEMATAIAAWHPGVSLYVDDIDDLHGVSAEEWAWHQEQIAMIVASDPLPEQASDMQGAAQVLWRDPAVKAYLESVGVNNLTDEERHVVVQTIADVAEREVSISPESDMQSPTPHEQARDAEIANRMARGQAPYTAWEILTDRLTPDAVADRLYDNAPGIEQFFDHRTLDALIAFASPGMEAYSAVVDQYLQSMRITAANARALKRRMSQVADAKLGTIVSRAQPASHWHLHPPVPPAYQHPDLLTKSGVTVLAGRPKMGKSYLALNLAIAIAENHPFGGKYPMNHTGDVLYLALEDNVGRMYSRLRALAPHAELPNRLYVDCHAPNLSADFVDQVTAWVTSVPEPRLIVIDIFALVATPKDLRENLYDAEYRDMARLKTLAETHDLHIMLVTHLNKNYGSALDIRDAVMSSTAIVGGASGIWVLAPEGQDHVDAKLLISGKDVPTWEAALHKNTVDGHIDWTLIGDNQQVLIRGMRANVLTALYRWQGESPTRQHLHEELCPDYNRTSFYNLIKRMRDDRQVIIQKNKLVLTHEGASAASALIAEQDAGPDPF